MKQVVSYWVAASVAILGMVSCSKTGGDTPDLKPYGDSFTETAADLNLKMVYVDGGTFMMGASTDEDSDAYDRESPVHQVTLAPFYIGVYEVTQEQWEAVMGDNPSQYSGENMPVDNVTWEAAGQFCEKLSALTGKTYVLPTEAQWEFAARGGNKSEGYKYSGSDTVDDVAWYWENSFFTTHPVGEKQPNELGLYDMSGNVYEWCSDWYGDYSADDTIDPAGPESGTQKCSRGGGWASNAAGVRNSYRGYYDVDFQYNILGLRVICLP